MDVLFMAHPDGVRIEPVEETGSLVRAGPIRAIRMYGAIRRRNWRASGNHRRSIRNLVYVVGKVVH